MNQPQTLIDTLPRYRVGLQPTGSGAVQLGPQVLAAFGFGIAPGADPRLHGLPLAGAAPMLEVWESPYPIQHWQDGSLRGSADGRIEFGQLVVSETAADIETAAADAYRVLMQHVHGSAYCHLLKVWNLIDAITEGDGDDERYRRFCVGRGREFDPLLDAFPAATAVGSFDGQRSLRLAWLAARQPGIALENPRQTEAWRYPRQHGPRSPSFARGLLPEPAAGLPLLLSGTAAIVGHASRHAADLQAQLDETLANVRALIHTARQTRPELPAELDPSSRLRIYLRDAADLGPVQALLQQRLPPSVPRIILHAAVCRRELLVEIEGVHGLAV